MKFRMSEIFSLVIALILGAGILTIKDLPRQASLFPLVIAIPALLLTIMTMVIDWMRLKSLAGNDDEGITMDISVDDSVPISTVVRRVISFFCCLFGFAAGIWLSGFFVTIPVFVFLYLFLVGKERGWFSLVYAAVVMGFVWGLFDLILNTFWLDGILQQWLIF